VSEERTIQSPLPGIFYRRANPQADPYVKEGDHVNPGDTVGLVEVMKSFFEVQAEDAGTVLRILAQNEDAVTAGQDIIVLGQ
jgi:acetyl-CoA carboxylase biotin carboxyl carrier protein